LLVIQIIANAVLNALQAVLNQAELQAVSAVVSAKLRGLLPLFSMI
jgi:hypothetical protein